MNEKGRDGGNYGRGKVEKAKIGKGRDEERLDRGKEGKENGVKGER